MAVVGLAKIPVFGKTAMTKSVKGMELRKKNGPDIESSGPSLVHLLPSISPRYASVPTKSEDYAYRAGA